MNEVDALREVEIDQVCVDRLNGQRVFLRVLCEVRKHRG